MGAALIIVEPPGFDLFLAIGDRGELVYVQTFNSQSAIKRLNEGVLLWFVGPNTVELHASVIGPTFKR